jgi:undecaprenyl-diphosphatase
MEFDTAVTKLINSLASKSGILDLLMVLIAKWGIVLLVAIIALRWWSKHDREMARYVVISCGFASALGLFLNHLLLLFVDRIRPYDRGLTNLIVERSQDPSFPSDHSTAVFAIAFFLLLRQDRYAIPFLIAAVLVGFSRIYIGTHYFSDVIGGAVTAAAAVAIVALLYRKESWVNRSLVKIL